MPKWTITGDMTTNSFPNLGGRGEQAYRPSNAVNTYSRGILLQIVPVNSQIFPDFQTVQPMPAAANGTKFAGVVADDWNGFDNAGIYPSSFLTPASQLNVRGTSFINAVVKGVAYVFVDTSAGVTITDGIPLTSSANTAGYAQGVAVASALPSIIGWANLPSSGIGSSLTGAALAQATAVFTITGTPASGDVITITLQNQYTDNQPGTVQTTAISTTLNATTAATVTTAAAAVVASLQANPLFATSTGFGIGGYFTAANAAGVITITVNASANGFLVTGGTAATSGSTTEQWRYFTFISGMVANTLTATSTYTQAGGSSGAISSPANFSGGTGYKGKVPALILGMY